MELELLTFEWNILTWRTWSKSRTLIKLIELALIFNIGEKCTNILDNFKPSIAAGGSGYQSSFQKVCFPPRISISVREMNIRQLACQQECDVILPSSKQYCDITSKELQLAGLYT